MDFPYVAKSIKIIKNNQIKVLVNENILNKIRSNQKVSEILLKLYCFNIYINKRQYLLDSGKIERVIDDLSVDDNDALYYWKGIYNKNEMGYIDDPIFRPLNDIE
jgi:hypothetical protein